jgi:hypothetical protein
VKTKVSYLYQDSNPLNFHSIACFFRGVTPCTLLDKQLPVEAMRCHHLQGERLSSRWRQHLYPTQWHVQPFITAWHRRTKHSSHILTLAISLTLGWAESPLLFITPTLKGWNRRKLRAWWRKKLQRRFFNFLLVWSFYFRLLLFTLKPCCDSWHLSPCFEVRGEEIWRMSSAVITVTMNTAVQYTAEFPFVGPPQAKSAPPSEIWAAFICT